MHAELSAALRQKIARLTPEEKHQLGNSLLPLVKELLAESEFTFCEDYPLRGHPPRLPESLDWN